jgi:phosphate transport system substrate-binding protein
MGNGRARSTYLKAGRRVAPLLAVSLLAAGCGAGAQPKGLSGRIVISGSSTVEPISIGVAERFDDANPAARISVDGPGTGDGFELFCNGETDISGASRAITPEEMESCNQEGVEYLELKVASDGIAVLTSPGNDRIGDCLSFSDIYALAGPESQGIDNWAEANDLAAEIGDTRGAPFRRAPLDITGPGEESGTYDSFVELVLEDIAEERGEEPVTRPDYQASPDDNVIIQGIEGSRTSMGWVGYAFYDANRERLKAFRVSGPDGACVAPGPETIADGSYPISRPLFIYVNRGKMARSPALESYVETYLSKEGLATAAEVGYVGLTPDETAAARAAFEAARPAKGA